MAIECGTSFVCSDWVSETAPQELDAHDGVFIGLERLYTGITA
jgi:hypothetical protein